VLALLENVDSKRNILFVLPSLNAGGAQGITATLLRHLNREKFEICLAIADSINKSHYSIPEDVTAYSFYHQKSRYALPSLIALIRRERPEVVFSTLGHLNLLIRLAHGLMPRYTVFVARETNIPSMNLLQSPYPRLFSFLYRRLYPKFDLVICQSEDMKKDLVDNFGLCPTKLLVINNPVDMEFITQQAKEGCSCYQSGVINLLAAGKLMFQKGFDLLLQAFARLDQERFHLTILGKGPEELPLKQRAQDLGIAQRVTFAGFQQNPYPYMAQADLFVLSSRFEGFPNVVLEANACGTPVVAFACPGGLKEIIREGENGMLARPENYLALAEKINEAARLSWEKNKIISSVSERYGVSKIIRQYEEAFSSLQPRTVHD
jgi:glycosyltransferase involved in cell wall biosynthesis